MDPFTGALLSGGVSLLGGLFGGKPKGMNTSKVIARENKERIEATNKREIAWNRQVEGKARRAAKIPVVTKTTGGVAIGRMMDAAERAGFNPVTFLQAGGLGAYTSTTQTVKNSNAFAAATVGLSKPAFSTYIRDAGSPSSIPREQSIGEKIGAALTTGMNTYLSMDASKQQMDLQREQMTAQIAAMTRSGNGYRGQAPAAAFYTPVSGGVNSGRSVQSGSGKPGLTFGPLTVTQAPTPDAADTENRYGEPGDWIFGAGNLVLDGIYTGVDLLKRADANARAQVPGVYTIGDAIEAGKGFFTSVAKTREAVAAGTGTWIPVPTRSNSRIAEREANPFW